MPTSLILFVCMVYVIFAKDFGSKPISLRSLLYSKVSRLMTFGLMAAPSVAKALQPSSSSSSSSTSSSSSSSSVCSTNPNPNPNPNPNLGLIEVEKLKENFAKGLPYG